MRPHVELREEKEGRSRRRGAIGEVEEVLRRTSKGVEAVCPPVVEAPPPDTHVKRRRVIDTLTSLWTQLYHPKRPMQDFKT